MVVTILVSLKKRPVWGGGGKERKEDGNDYSALST